MRRSSFMGGPVEGGGYRPPRAPDAVTWALLLVVLVLAVVGFGLVVLAVTR